MSEIEIITDGGCRRRWSAADKLRIVEETLYDGESICAVARRIGVAPKLLYRWHQEGSENSPGGGLFSPTQVMLEEGSIAVTGDDSVTSNKTVREMEGRIRELERQLGRKTLEVEILKEALDKSRSKKNRPCLRSRSNRTAPDEGGGTDIGRVPFEPA